MNTTLSKKLQARHVNMIAFGGSIGTGLFLVSGYAIAVGGPGGALLAYAAMAVIVYFLMIALAEMSSFKPSTGSFCEYSSEYISQSFGIAMGYNYWFSWASCIAVEVLAGTQIIGFWFPTINPMIFTFLIFALIVTTNLLIVKVYGEIEYGLSYIKVFAILLFITLGFLSIFKTPHFGFNHFYILDGPFHQGIYGFMAVFLFVGLSFQGTELVGVASEETENPEITIPNAIKMVFWRLTLFYILSILVISLLIPFNDPNLVSKDNVLTSPFTLLFKNYIGHYAADFVNFIILIAVISAANASLYSSSRILWYLGKSGQGPRCFMRTSRKGVPIFGLVITALFGGILIATSVFGEGLIFNYIVQISSLSGFLVWFGIALSHYQFRKKYLPARKIEPGQLKFRSKFFPFSTLLCLATIISIIVGQLFMQEHPFNGFKFFITYLSIVSFLIIYFGHKTYLFFQKKAESKEVPLNI